MVKKTDYPVEQLVINELTSAQYAAAKAAGEIDEHELYLVTDESFYTAAEVDKMVPTAAEKASWNEKSKVHLASGVSSYNYVAHYIKIDDDSFTQMGDIVTVSSSGSSSSGEVSYITINNQEYKLAGSGGGGSTVTVDQKVTSGAEIAEITVDDTTVNIYNGVSVLSSKPSGASELKYLKIGSTNYKLAGGSAVSVTQTQKSGTEIARITVDGVETVIYAPSYDDGSTLEY